MHTLMGEEDTPVEERNTTLIFLLVQLLAIIDHGSFEMKGNSLQV